MSDKLELIKQEDARIVWNDGDKEELHVYEYKESESYRYRLEKSNPLHKKDLYKHCGFSGGNCFDKFGEISKDELIALCFDIIIFYKFTDLEMCFYEFGQIEELECMRKLLYMNFPNRAGSSHHTYNEFIKKVYTKGFSF